MNSIGIRMGQTPTEFLKETNKCFPVMPFRTNHHQDESDAASVNVTAILPVTFAEPEPIQTNYLSNKEKDGEEIREILVSTIAKHRACNFITNKENNNLEKALHSLGASTFSVLYF